jgi:hypothetical protein
MAHLRLENYKPKHEFESHLPDRACLVLDSQVEVLSENVRFSGQIARTSGEAQSRVRIQILSAIRSPVFFLVELVSYSEGLDLSIAKGKVVYQMLSAFAGFGHDCIRERVTSSLRYRWRPGSFRS